MLLDDCYISFVNMDHRRDRLDHMTAELSRINLNAVRTRGIPWQEVTAPRESIATMLNRTPGAIGCHFSQVSIMKEAKRLGKNAMVLEDDLIFCSDLHARLDYLEGWLSGKEWDVCWLGGTFHSPAFWHKFGRSGMPPNCSANLGKDCETTDDPRIMRTYGAFSTHAYIVNGKSIDKILTLFDMHIHESIGIDHLFIRLQPQLKCYAFVPGMVKQMDNMSDIGTGMTIFSGFSKLNGTIENSMYWWQDKMEDFNATNFKWQ